MDLAGRTIVVTGGSSGIGRSTALVAADHGANVVVADITPEPRRDVEPTVTAVREKGQEGAFVDVDVTNLDDLEDVTEVATELSGRFDGWVNNAGDGTTDNIKRTSPTDWRRSIETNLTGTFNGCRVAIERMLAGEGGSIVNVASAAGVIGFLNSAAYSAAKGGVISLTRQIAVDFAPDEIRVNAVSPGFTDTEMLQQDTHDGTEGYAVDKTPMNRVCRPEEIGSTVVFLLSSEASFITGQNIPVDGGYTVK